MTTSAKRSPKVPHKEQQPPPAPAIRTREERLNAGRALRERVPFESHSEWKASRTGRNPVETLERSSVGRLPELVPIRYGRMLRTPFTFLRGAAAVMAQDLAKTANSGLHVQACGDCHLLNFGLFATPERNLVFDINDFDETHPAPWEWDLKRLLASIVISARDNRLSASEARAAVRECARSYRERMREYSRMTPMEVWYQRLDWDMVIAAAPDAKSKRLRKQLADEARKRIVEHLFPKIAEGKDGRHQLVDQPPLLFHPNETDLDTRVSEALSAFRLTLSDDRRVLLDRYRLEDYALKVVGIGSVGTRSFIVLLMSEDNHPLLLQVKEAGRSVLEPYLARSVYDNQGQRIVMGQRLMQSSSDIFLGWARARGGKDFYFRQLRDMKMSIPLEHLKAKQLKRYANVCGWTLARAHAKSGDAAAISGYLGRSDSFDRAVTRFAFAYADQTERDHAALVKAVRAGRVQALTEG
jgi:uncharacterized protein (DUF2252 family)